MSFWSFISGSSASDKVAKDMSGPTVVTAGLTSSKVASDAGRLMHHPDPSVRSTAASALSQAKDTSKDA